MELPENILNMQLEAAPEQETSQPKQKENKPLLRIITEKRRGKMATIIYAEPALNDETAEGLARELKQRLAVGGSTRDGEILLQGNLKDKAIATLRQLGYKAK